MTFRRNPRSSKTAWFDRIKSRQVNCWWPRPNFVTAISGVKTRMMGISGGEMISTISRCLYCIRWAVLIQCRNVTETRTDKWKRMDEIEIALSILSVAFMPDCRILHQILCIFVTGGAYAPYAPCLPTPLHNMMFKRPTFALSWGLANPEWLQSSDGEQGV